MSYTPPPHPSILGGPPPPLPLTTPLRTAPVSIRLGGGVRLHLVTDLLRMFSPLGYTEDTFIKLLHSIRVPIIFLGSFAYVDFAVLKIAFKSISRIGMPDFVSPAQLSDPLPSSASPDAISSLPLSTLKENLRDVVAELIYSRQMTSRDIDPDIIEAAAAAAQRLLLASLHHAPLKEQQRQAAPLRRRLEQEILTDDTPDRVNAAFSLPPDTGE